MRFEAAVLGLTVCLFDKRRAFDVSAADTVGGFCRDVILIESSEKKITVKIQNEYLRSSILDLPKSAIIPCIFLFSE